MASDADEVAEDYRHALEDLSSNMRFEISNLTVIARENTEHALVISEVLQQHILKVGPSKKLPALYVLDSIVKNVGTPYTLYFGRNLFKIFMESYAVVDNSIRKKMEDMLRTWKDPVPGSMDTRPVFSHELVRPIENALMKVKGVTMQQQGAMMNRPHSAAMMVPHRNTPTPPHMRGVAGPPGAFAQQGYPQNGGGQHYAGQPPQVGQNQYNNGATPQPQSQPHGPYQPPPHQVPFSDGALPPGASVETLSRDIQRLVVAAKAELSHVPQDSSVQARLKGLLDLQNILQHQTLPPDQLELIRNKVNELSVTFNNQAPGQGQGPAMTQVSGLAPAQSQYYPPQPHSNSVTPQPSVQSQGPGHGQAPPVTLDSLLGQGALAALLARNSATPQAPTPTQQSSMPFRPPTAQINTPTPAAQAPQAPQMPTQNASSLLDQLRKAGLLGASTSTPPASVTPQPQSEPPPPSTTAPPQLQQHQPPPTVPVIPANIASLLASAQRAGLAQPPLIKPVSSETSSAWLKTPLVPNSISRLYDSLGVPCTQCGRRFRGDEEGRKKKMAHMDWHFRVHQRSTEVEKRGLYRSWYVDAKDWLASREIPDTDHASLTEKDPSQSSAKDSQANKLRYIPIPDASRGVNNVCPICQEKFENKWLDTAQEWVWIDAVLVGNRAYHASCHDEATRDREGTPGLRRTPEPGTVLGKRKAEGGMASPKVRTLRTWA